ncbi:mannose-1-phosphate guanylyltransferase/mannose-6-phosphate isomerase [Bradyrhizobium sp. HKCCYLS20291]|uniref:mannose-1-phosphate guanylyltransferase/mannose-6-phosphate isomerase n=1 Tax=Bradyrhizobium sp. HKCCYLS20291 TaxID=3420766 RepID=UPI003EBD26C2
MTKLLPVIMCGGSGTRMWPESRETYPKQFIALLGERSTFQMALQTVSAEMFQDPIVITNAAYRFLVRDQMQAIGISGQIVLEPVARDSGPAVAVAAQIAAAADPETVIVMLAADHVIRDTAAFLAACEKAAAAATQGAIVTLGITPTEPATGYGYIRPQRHSGADGGAVRIEQFVEKPNADLARKYVADGYFWNSGNFVFRADVMRDEIAAFEPDMAKAVAGAVAAAQHDLDFIVLDRTAFEQATKKSIDFAVMERTAKAAVVPVDMGWSDVGSWGTIWELSQRDRSGNSILGRGAVLNARNVHIRSSEHLTAVVGVDDVVVVTTQDAVLVLRRDQADKVKDLVQQLKASDRKEASEHRRSFRPWGYYQSIDQGSRYQVKRIVVKPGQRLSLQKHFHRAEHWIVVSGVAEVTRDDEIRIVHENESIYLPLGSVHRLTNPGKIDLELIEVQTGSYLGEDDIIRIEDIYNRT